MLTALDSRRYAVFVERFSAVLEQGAPRRFAPGNAPVLLAAPALLEKRYRGVRRRGGRITPGSAPSAYHLLRIDAKKLRYALEFVGPVYGKQAVEFSQRVTALQDVLGLHQDAEVAVTMLEEMAVQQGRRLPVETVLAMGALAERYRVQGAALRRQFPGVYRPLKGKNWRNLERLIEGRRALAAAGPAAAGGVRTGARGAGRPGS
jgi:triphosphatase